LISFDDYMCTGFSAFTHSMPTQNLACEVSSILCYRFNFI